MNEQNEVPEINGIARVLGSNHSGPSEDERQALIDEIEPQGGWLLLEEIREESEIIVAGGGEADVKARFRVLKTGRGEYNPHTGNSAPMNFRPGDVIMPSESLPYPWGQEMNLLIMPSSRAVIRYKQPKSAVEVVD